MRMQVNKVGRDFSNYLKLAKPRIMLLVLLTGAAALVMEGSLLHSPVRFCLVLLGLLLSGGSANAFNMYFEREVDSLMSRTRLKRPLPLGIIKPKNALIFATGIGILGVFLFAVSFNFLSALMSLGTIVFYSYFYTIFLKPRTRYNIVIGGAAGSMAPVIAWAAASGTIALQPLIMFAIIFLWTPPHFWSLALMAKKDYELVGYPMMPLAIGDRKTIRQIFFYSLALVIFSILLLFAGAGLIYLLTVAVAGSLFIYKAALLLGARPGITPRSVFAYSIIYLFAVFTSVIADATIKTIL
jgi:protoheme IX farnesyltransferase